MTKSDLRTGMFGKDSDGTIFVVVNDKLMYEGGDYYPIRMLTDDLRFDEEDSIVELHEAVCFNQVKDGNSSLIWTRGGVKEATADKEPTNPDGSITITPEKFLDAVRVANDKFLEVAKETPGDGMIDALMGVQNLAFGSLIGHILFGEDTDAE